MHILHKVNILSMIVLIFILGRRLRTSASPKGPAIIPAEYRINSLLEKINPQAREAEKTWRSTASETIFRTASSKSSYDIARENSSMTKASGATIYLATPSVYLGEAMKEDDLLCDDPVSEQSTLRDLEVIKHGQPVKVPALAVPAATPDHLDHCSTHVPFMKGCPNARSCRIQNQPCRRATLKDKTVKPDELPIPKAGLDAVTADHAICGKYEKLRNGDTCAMVIQDRYTIWICSYPMRT